ncbi:MAG: WecB/TagA/CpsF family glycosyltransferase, partial [Rhodoferax sp.]|nr:WecB/TagA/CpsF family glycosyltransferase [Rhodoferax sp.]
MNTWIDESHSTVSAVPLPANHRADRGLRLMDLVLALLACGPLLVPALLLLAVGRLRSQRLVGRYNAVFKRWHFEFPDSTLGRWLQGSGLAQLPTVWSILKGDMAWVGPQAHAADGELDCHPALATLRPGWVSIWQLQQRTAVHFGTELESDLRYARVRGVRHDAGVLLRSALTLWMAAPRAADQERVCIGDVEFDNVDMRQALERISRMLDGNRTQQVSFVNPACINIAAGNRAYRRVLARAALVLPDGIGVKIAADVMRSPLRQNVNGTDLFPRLCDVLEARGARLFLLGGQAGVAQKVARVVRKHWPRLRVVGVRDGFFSLAEEGEVAAQVRASGADIVLVARGVPMQDLFIDRHLHQLGVKVAMGVGGLFDFVSGRIDRAPRWMRDSGLEWIYRLMQEPSRMWRRYIIGNFTFLLRVGLQRLGLRASATDL